MPKGIQKQPKMETKLTAVTMSRNGLKVQVFLDLPIINGKSVLPYETKAKLEEELGAVRGDTISMG